MWNVILYITAILTRSKRVSIACSTASLDGGSIALAINGLIEPSFNSYNTHTHNRFTAGLEYVRVHPGQQVPER